MNFQQHIGQLRKQRKEKHRQIKTKIVRNLVSKISARKNCHSTSGNVENQNKENNSKQEFVTKTKHGNKVYYFPKKREIRTGMKPSNWVATTIFPRRNWSFPMALLQVLHDDRADLAYSAFHGCGGLAIVVSSKRRSQTTLIDSLQREREREEEEKGERNLLIS